MRLWLSLVTVLVLLLCEYGDAREKRGFLGLNHEQLEDCPDDSACIVFGDSDCQIDGKIVKAFPWRKLFTSKVSLCNRKYQKVFARLDIQPLSLTNWKVKAILLKERNTENIEYKPEDYEFHFENAKITFVNDTAARFSWKKSEEGISDAKMNKKDFESSDTIFRGVRWWFGTLDHFKFYATDFEISANGEKLFDFISSKVVMHKKGQTIEMDDSEFPEQLSLNTKCDLSEVKNRVVCHDTCDEMFPKSNSTDSTDSTNSTDSSISNEWRYTREPPACPSILWFHDTSEAGMIRHWKQVDTLQCSMGYWQADWSQHEEGKPARGTRKFNGSEQFQCSSMHPELVTTQWKIVVAVCSVIGGLLFIGIIVLLVLCLLRKRRRRKNAKKFQFGADTTLGSGSTIGLPGKSTEREGTLRDSGTQREGGTQREEPKRAWWSPKKKSSPKVDSSPMKVDSSPLKVDSSPAKYENYTPTGTHAA